MWGRGNLGQDLTSLDLSFLPCKVGAVQTSSLAVILGPRQAPAGAPEPAMLPPGLRRPGREVGPQSAARPGLPLAGDPLCPRGSLDTQCGNWLPLLPLVLGPLCHLTSPEVRVILGLGAPWTGVLSPHPTPSHPLPWWSVSCWLLLPCHDSASRGAVPSLGEPRMVFPGACEKQVLRRVERRGAHVGFSSAFGDSLMCFSHLLFNLRTGGIKIILAIILREDWVPSSGPGGLPTAPPWPRQDLAFPFSSGRVGQREDPAPSHQPWAPGCWATQRVGPRASLCRQPVRRIPSPQACWH